MRAVKLYILLIALLLSNALVADEDVRFTGSAKQLVESGERFQVVYEVNAEGRNFTSPNFGNLQVLTGPNTSTSSSVQYINGKMTQSYSLTFTFIVQATQEGDVTISHATVTVDGKKYASNTIKIKVVNAAGAQQGNTGNNSQSDAANGVLQDDDVYIKAYMDNTNPYLGEQIIVSYKIFTKVPITNLGMQKSPSYPGFWSKNLMEDNSKFKQSTQVIDGEEYIVADIAKYALFPQKSGELTIESVEMECTAQLRMQSNRKRTNDPFESFFNDPFFNRNVKNVKTTLASKPIKINVKPLPQQGKPDSFKGAVGDFSFKSEIDKSNLTANDALTLNVTISGRGNVELVTAPIIQFPPDFETYEPKVKSNIQSNLSGISGSKSFEYLAIPRNPGDFKIDPVKFSYFNPKDGKYYSFSSGELEVSVEKGDQNSGGITYSSSAQEDIRFIGRDIHHIKTGIFDLKQKGTFLFASSTFYIFIGLPVALLIIFIVLWKRQEKRKHNTGLMKTRKANKIARERLKKAEKLKKANDEKAFYDEIAQALWGYIADKFNIKKSNLSINKVRESLEAKSVNTDVIDRFINTLNNIDFARFAPGDSGGKMENVYNEAIDAITQAEKELK
ncbi:MAG: BatD family protein [Bacteroidales bacterium]|jgi:hypothetical protein|nr:BatD family protein [Bacteroidales bacterium]